MKHEKELEPYLPTLEELEGMSLGSFGNWVIRADEEIPKRVIMRDPLTNLRKRISTLLSKHFNTEAEKEEAVHYEIRKHHKLNL